MTVEDAIDRLAPVDALLFLALAALLTHAAARRHELALLAIVFAALAGTTLPDLDAALGLGHRSGLTHSLLPAAIALARPGWRPVAIGLALGVGLHLSADLFPNAMRGYATIKLPGEGSIGGRASYLWLLANAGAALALGGWLLARFTDRLRAALTLAAVAVVGVGYLWATDGGWPALALFAGAGAALTRRRWPRARPPAGD